MLCLSGKILTSQAKIVILKKSCHDMINRIQHERPYIIEIIKLVAKHNKFSTKPCILSLLHTLFYKFNNI